MAHLLGNISHYATETDTWTRYKLVQKIYKRGTR